MGQFETWLQFAVIYWVITLLLNCILLIKRKVLSNMPLHGVKNSVDVKATIIVFWKLTVTGSKNKI